MSHVVVGHNSIHYIQKCDYTYEEQEVPEEPVILECLTAQHEAKLFAKTIASLAKYDITDTETVLKKLGECEIMAGKSIYIKLDIFGDCLQGEFKNYYDIFF